MKLHKRKDRGITHRASLYTFENVLGEGIPQKKNTEQQQQHALHANTLEICYTTMQAEEAKETSQDVHTQELGQIL